MLGPSIFRAPHEETHFVNVAGCSYGMCLIIYRAENNTLLGIRDLGFFSGLDWGNGNWKYSGFGIWIK